jgi:hypothetical protein
VNIMDCRTCQPTLIDLLHGELATDAAEEAHAHLKECASCRSAFDKLSQGLRFAQRMPLIEPPQAVGARLLQLAEQHAHAAAALRKQDAPRPGAWQSLLDFVARFAMTRQVGMATIMLLIVAVGMWSLPALQRSRVADGGTVVSLEHEDEVAASPVVVPEQEPVAAPAAPAPALEAPPEAMAESSPAKVMQQPRASSYRAGSSLRETAASKSAARPDGDLLRRSAGSSSKAGPTKAKREAEAFPGNTGLAAQTEEQNTAPSAAPDPRGRKAPARDELVELDALGGVVGKGKDDAPADRSQGRGAAAPASPPPAPTMAAEGEAMEKKSKAKSALSSNACDPARMREYQRTVDAAPSSAAAGNALLAMARCRNLTGEYTLARGLLERAARNPYVADRAKAMLGTARPAKPASAAEAPAAAEPASSD